MQTLTPWAALSPSVLVKSSPMNLHIPVAEMKHRKLLSSYDHCSLELFKLVFRGTESQADRLFSSTRKFLNLTKVIPHTIFIYLNLFFLLFMPISGHVLPCGVPASK